jgi:hypothetical protein
MCTPLLRAREVIGPVIEAEHYDTQLTAINDSSEAVELRRRTRLGQDQETKKRHRPNHARNFA